MTGSDTARGVWQFFGGMLVLVAGLAFIAGASWVGHALGLWSPAPLGW